MLRLTINGQEHIFDGDLDPAMPLLWLLRDNVGLLGTKYGCGAGFCGACTVHLNGSAVRSCSIPAASAVGMRVTTIEGLSGVNGRLHPLQQAWIDHDVPQCGYCQAGQLMSAAALLEANPKPTDADIDLALQGNLCRCGTYQRIRAAVHAAAAARGRHHE
jgi:isoquinoline 1-oxidoreductase alpha subunit